MRKRGYRRGGFGFTPSRIQTQGQRPMVRNPVSPTAYGTQFDNGYQLAERPADIRRDVENNRRVLQEKYQQQAAEAEEKRLRREKKKREEWLKRQESLVRPGYRLGHGTQPANLQRDLVEHQNATECDPQEGRAHEQEAADQQLRMLVQERMQRDRDGEEFDSQMRRHDIQVRRQQQREAEMRKRGNRLFGSVNRGAAAHSNFAPQNSPSTSNTRGSANPRKPANFLDVAANASSTSDTRASGDPTKPEKFLDVAQTSSATSNTNASGNPRKPENFLGVALNSSLTSNTNDTRQGTSGHVLGQASNVPTSSSQSEPEVDYREQMRAARLRMQERYTEHLRNAVQVNEQEVNNMAGEVQQVSLK